MAPQAALDPCAASQTALEVLVYVKMNAQYPGPSNSQDRVKKQTCLKQQLVNEATSAQGVMPHPSNK
jgi:hypothetical protein